MGLQDQQQQTWCLNRLSLQNLPIMSSGALGHLERRHNWPTTTSWGMVWYGGDLGDSQGMVGIRVRLSVMVFNTFIHFKEF